MTSKLMTDEEIPRYQWVPNGMLSIDAKKISILMDMKLDDHYYKGSDVEKHYIKKSKSVPVERIRKAIEELEQKKTKHLKHMIMPLEHSCPWCDALDSKIEVLNSLLKEVD